MTQQELEARINELEERVSGLESRWSDTDMAREVATELSRQLAELGQRRKRIY